MLQETSSAKPKKSENQQQQSSKKAIVKEIPVKKQGQNQKKIVSYNSESQIMNNSEQNDKFSRNLQFSNVKSEIVSPQSLVSEENLKKLEKLNESNKMEISFMENLKNQFSPDQFNIGNKKQYNNYFTNTQKQNSPKNTTNGNQKTQTSSDYTQLNQDSSSMTQQNMKNSSLYRQKLTLLTQDFDISQQGPISINSMSNNITTIQSLEASELQSHRSNYQSEKTTKQNQEKQQEKLKEELQKQCRKLKQQEEESAQQQQKEEVEEQQEEIKCRSHGKFCSFFCEQCSAILCVDCIYDNKSSLEHMDHNVLALSQSYGLLKERNRISQIQMEEKIKKVQESISINSKNEILLQNNLQKQIEELNSEFQKFILMVEGRKNQLQQQLVGLFSQKIEECNKSKFDLIKLKECLQNQVNQSDQFKQNENNDYKILYDFQIYQILNSAFSNIEFDFRRLNIEELKILNVKNTREELGKFLQNMGNVHQELHIRESQLKQSSRKSIDSTKKELSNTKGKKSQQSNSTMKKDLSPEKKQIYDFQKIHQRKKSLQQQQSNYNSNQSSKQKLRHSTPSPTKAQVSLQRKQQNINNNNEGSIGQVGNGQKRNNSVSYLSQNRNSIRQNIEQSVQNTNSSNTTTNNNGNLKDSYAQKHKEKIEKKQVRNKSAEINRGHLKLYQENQNTQQSLNKSVVQIQSNVTTCSDLSQISKNPSKNNLISNNNTIIEENQKPQPTQNAKNCQQTQQNSQKQDKWNSLFWKKETILQKQQNMISSRQNKAQNLLKSGFSTSRQQPQQHSQLNQQNYSSQQEKQSNKQLSSQSDIMMTYFNLYKSSKDTFLSPKQ